MFKYIEYKKFIRKLNYICKTYGVPKLIVEKIKKAISDSFATDVVEVVHGTWIEETFESIIPAEITDQGIKMKTYTINRCNVCGRTEPKKEPYCNCGAKMDGENNE